MNKKTTLTLWLALALTCLPAASRAADLVTTLLVLTKDNVQHQFALPEKPKVSFEGDNLVIHSEKTDASFPLSNVVRFTYLKTDPSGIMQLRDAETEVGYADGTLVISQLKAGSTVGVYTLDGRLAQQLHARHAGTYRISLASLPFGVYLVKTGNTTYKITKR